ncbi:Hypothetical predicted protein, partial [Olea europaea subsp. europaea]
SDDFLQRNNYYAYCNRAMSSPCRVAADHNSIINSALRRRLPIVAIERDKRWDRERRWIIERMKMIRV